MVIATAMWAAALRAPAAKARLGGGPLQAWTERGRLARFVQATNDFCDLLALACDPPVARAAAAAALAHRPSRKNGFFGRGVYVLSRPHGSGGSADGMRTGTSALRAPTSWRMTGAPKRRAQRPLGISGGPMLIWKSLS